MDNHDFSCRVKPPHAECHSSQGPFTLRSWVKYCNVDGFSTSLMNAMTWHGNPNAWRNIWRCPEKAKRPSREEQMDRTWQRRRNGRRNSVQDSTWLNGHTPERIRGGVHQRTHMCTSGGTLTVALDRPSSFVVHLWPVRSWPCHGSLSVSPAQSPSALGK